MVSEFLPPNAEKVKDPFESMMTVCIPKWERSSKGDGGQHGDDNDNNSLHDQEENMDGILHDNNISDDSSDDANGNQKPAYGVLASRSCFALSKIKDFFENHNSVIYLVWHMIAKHQLFSSLMNILANGVGSRSGARGIPSAIAAKYREHKEEGEEDGSSVSRSFLSISSVSKDHNDGGDDLSRSIREHVSRLHAFAMAKKEASLKQIEHATLKEKCKCFDTIQLEIGQLHAEKQQLLIQKCSTGGGVGFLEFSIVCLPSSKKMVREYSLEQKNAEMVREYLLKQKIEFGSAPVCLQRCVTVSGQSAGQTHKKVHFSSLPKAACRHTPRPTISRESCLQFCI